MTAMFTENTFPVRNRGRRGAGFGHREVREGRGGGWCPMCHPLPPSSIIADPLNTHSRSRLYTGGEVRGCK